MGITAFVAVLGGLARDGTVVNEGAALVPCATRAAHARGACAVDAVGTVATGFRCDIVRWAEFVPVAWNTYSSNGVFTAAVFILTAVAITFTAALTAAATNMHKSIILFASDTRLIACAL